MENKVYKYFGDKRKTPCHPARFYTVDNQRYFSVRKIEDQGPYCSKLSAEIGLKMYLLDVEHFKIEKYNKLKQG